MHGLIEHDAALTGAQALDQGHGQRRIARSRQPMIGDDVGIRQHPDFPIALADLAHQHVAAGGDDRPQAGAPHELDR